MSPSVGYGDLDLFLPSPPKPSYGFHRESGFTSAKRMGIQSIFCNPIIFMDTDSSQSLHFCCGLNRVPPKTVSGSSNLPGM